MDFLPEDSRFFIQNELETRLRRRPHYSLRAFARDLEIAPSTLSDFLKGKLGFSRERVFSVSKKLNLSTEQRDHFWDLVESKFARSTEKKKIAKLRVTSRCQSIDTRLSLEIFKIISDWQHFAILELMGMNEKYFQAANLTKALRLPAKEIKQSLARLESVGLINKEGELYKPTHKDVFVGQNIPSQAIRKFHAQILSKAMDAIEEQTIEEREFSSNIISFRKEDLKSFKADINRSWLEIATKYSEKSNRDSLYCFSLQLFNLAQPNDFLKEIETKSETP